MKALWVVFESDPHQSYDSYVVKAIHGNEQLMRLEFERLSNLFTSTNTNQYKLHLARYDPPQTVSLYGDFRRDLEIVSTSS